MNVDQEQLRLLPSVDELLHSTSGQQLIQRYSRSMTLQAVRASISQARAQIRQGASCPSSDEILTVAEHFLDESQRPNLQPVINATGVIINTNLGRSPLSQEALLAVQWVAGGYTNLEYELEAGERGSRHSHVSTLLCELTSAEAALVTNNNAAAVLLALSTLAAGREVIISRGQLVEIGGGFRVPDVMSQSGCKLIEVGTTNRTRLSDYEAAITERTALLLTVHPSNFQIVGFTESTSVEALAELAHEHGLQLMDDLGSGCLLASERYGLGHEPMPQESIAAEADVVCFSGDKLLGGPQAGILVGKAAALKRINKHPLLRAMRIDKMTLAALEASRASISGRAASWVSKLQKYGIPARMQHGESTVGGGSLPGETLPTTLLALDAGNVSMSLDELAKRLRLRNSPLIVRILRDALLIDPRTVLEEQDNEVVQALAEELEKDGVG